MKTTLLLAALLALTPAALAVPLSGDGCGGAGGPALGLLDTGVGLYVEGTSDGVWVWQESNGVAGFQRGAGSSVLLPGDAYACVPDDGRPPGDTLLL